MASVSIQTDNLKKLLSHPDAKESLGLIAYELVEAAKAIYLSQRVLPDHNEYLDSFEVEETKRGYIVRNTDREAFWVEFGAHAGGKTPVLGYAPLRKAIDVVSSEF